MGEETLPDRADCAAVVYHLVGDSGQGSIVEGCIRAGAFLDFVPQFQCRLLAHQTQFLQIPAGRLRSSVSGNSGETVSARGI